MTKLKGMTNHDYAIKFKYTNIIMQQYVCVSIKIKKRWLAGGIIYTLSLNYLLLNLSNIQKRKKNKLIYREELFFFCIKNYRHAQIKHNLLQVAFDFEAPLTNCLSFVCVETNRLTFDQVKNSCILFSIW